MSKDFATKLLLLWRRIFAEKIYILFFFFFLNGNNTLQINRKSYRVENSQSILGSEPSLKRAVTSKTIKAGPKHITSALHVPPGFPSNLGLQWLLPAWLLCQVQVACPDTDLLTAMVTLIGRFLRGP